MYRDDSSLEAMVRELQRRIRVLETQAPVGFTAVSRGALRILSAEGLIVEGSARVGGLLAVTGTETVDGRLEGSGVLDWSGAVWLRGSVMIPGNLTGVGTLLWSGPWELRGNGSITGNATILGTLAVNGAATLNNDLTLGSGRIVAGSIVIDKNGGYGGRLTAATLLFDTASALFTGTATAENLFAQGDITATGDLSILGNSTVLGTKSFRMPHPLKDEHWLQHGCTESPISGTEYTGRATIGEDGSAVVELPDYFEALNKPRNRTVQITPVGRPFAVGADDVLDGKVTVYGDPGRDVFWLVKAERTGGDFETESAIPPAPVNYD